MSGRAQLMWDEAVTGYDFGPDHPMDPVRLDLTRRLVDAFGLDRDVEVVSAKAAGESTLRLVHREDYVEAVKAASVDPEAADQAYGLGTMDDPAFPRMHDVSALIAGQSVGAAEAVWRGQALHAVNFAGGLHHAMPGGASGFCIYNDASLAIARLLELGAERVAYVDVDVHHGDGVQAAFWEDPRVLTISLHEHPRTLFPQTGWPEETGADSAEGSAANVALPAGTGDAGWLRAFHAVVPELIADFRPDVLVTQHGADTHFEDPLAHLAVSLDAQRAVQVACHELAHEYAGGKWIALGGRGVRRGGCRAPVLDASGGDRRGAAGRARGDDSRGVAAGSVRPDPAVGAGPDDGRPVAGGLCGVGCGVRPRGSAGSGCAGHSAGGVPVAGLAGVAAHDGPQLCRSVTPSVRCFPVPIPSLAPSRHHHSRVEHRCPPRPSAGRSSGRARGHLPGGESAELSVVRGSRSEGADRDRSRVVVE
ncbi:UNVERIFIED_CONTAM: acetoin utilization deacetylase AcuC-like enzyme [Streptomyces canus]